MNITTIEIRNVKGIDSHKYDLRLMPNKPNLLVAPNGFGKSSFATAFASMNSKRMDLSKNDCYQCNDANLPKLLLTVEDDSKNTTTLKV